MNKNNRTYIIILVFATILILITFGLLYTGLLSTQSNEIVDTETLISPTTRNRIIVTETEKPTVTIVKITNTSTDVVNTQEIHDESYCSESEPYKITSREVVWLEWSVEDSQLFYRYRDSDQYYAFDPSTCETDTITADQVYKTIYGDATIDNFDVPDGINEHQIAINPPGTLIIYTKERILDPINTATPDGEGPINERKVSDIYFLYKEQETPVLLGTIDAIVDNFTWLDNQSDLLIHTIPRFPGMAYIWHANLNNQTLTPLIKVREGFSDFSFKALSLDGSRFLYRSESGLYLYYLTSNSEEKLSLNGSLRDYYWFISPNKLLVVDDFGDALEFQLAVFDIQAGSLTYIEHEPLRIHSVDMSADMKYLAIRWDSSLYLYIFPIYELH